MIPTWAALLVLGLATAAPQMRVLTQQQALASAVALYNQQRPSEWAFRLLEAEPQADWDPTSPSPQGLKFSIKETVCPSSQTHNLTQCDYKEDGLDRDCSGIYSTQQSPIVSVQCQDMDRELKRISRRRWRRSAQRPPLLFGLPFTSKPT
ncbi:cathelicidin-related peptide Oh-Cath-like [Crotalus tigris]|uniref:cathelicidin-related peptide Oh-Cath-like n=1 Tax=Crotalus tigris TaxID=88082 RepID=UPI00192F2CA2|nr:cathelicidin-related peptide Oh-Cath-like [Crotalus tigris]